MTKTAEKPYPFGAAHTYIAHIRDYSGGSGTDVLGLALRESVVLKI